MPYDFVKTQQQKDREGVKAVYKNTIKTIREIAVMPGGIRTLYVGWKIRLCQYILNSVFTVVLMEKLEMSFKKLDKDGI